MGEPIETTGRNPNQLNKEVERWIESEMRRIDPTAYRSETPSARHEAAA
jgi:1-acyl-sn-glycerol-3-phosphate acyltransferase